jgi:hypothetical protein
MRQPARQEPYQKELSAKLAISLPRSLAAAARVAAQARGAPSLSAFIAEAIEEKIAGDRLQEVLDEIFGDQPLTDEERACVDRHFFKP